MIDINKLNTLSVEESLLVLANSLNSIEDELNIIQNQIKPLSTKMDYVIRTNNSINSSVSTIKERTHEQETKQESLEILLKSLAESINKAQLFIDQVKERQHTNINNIDKLTKEKETLRQDIVRHASQVNEKLSKVHTVSENFIDLKDEIHKSNRISHTAIYTALGCLFFVTIISVMNLFSLFEKMLWYFRLLFE